MNDKHIDDLIDVAAREMVRREPQPALSQSVGARIRGDRTRGWKWRWVPAGAAAAIAMAFLLASWSVDVTIPPIARAAIPGASAVPPAAPEQALGAQAPVVPGGSPQVARPSNPSAVSASREALPAPDRIVVTTIELVPIAQETTMVETLTIDPLVVAPLTTSND